VTADKLVGVGEFFSNQIHPPKLKFAAGKSELDLHRILVAADFFETQQVWLARKNAHN
jgi:hypothetical protein